jgi:hypothetical protein
MNLMESIIEGHGSDNESVRAQKPTKHTSMVQKQLFRKSDLITPEKAQLLLQLLELP